MSALRSQLVMEVHSGINVKCLSQLIAEVLVLDSLAELATSIEIAVLGILMKQFVAVLVVDFGVYLGRIAILSETHILTIHSIHPI